MNSSLPIGIALGLTFAVLVVRPRAPQQMALMGTSAVLFVASALVEGKWSQFAWQIVGMVVVLLLVRWVNWSSKRWQNDDTS